MEKNKEDLTLKRKQAEIFDALNSVIADLDSIEVAKARSERLEKAISTLSKYATEYTHVQAICERLNAVKKQKIATADQVAKLKEERDKALEVIKRTTVQISDSKHFPGQQLSIFDK